MRQDDNQQWLDDLLLQHLKMKTGNFDFRQWQKEYPGEAKQLCLARPSKEGNFSWALMWRTIMNNPITKYGTVAAGLFIAVMFLFPAKEMIPGSILLADVQRKILDQHSCFISGTRILTTKSEEPRTSTLTVHKYLSRDYGYVDQTFDEEGNLLISLSVYHPDSIVTILLPQMKRYAQFPIPQKYMERMKNVTPLRLFAMLFYKGDYKDLEKIDLETLDVASLDCTKEARIQGIQAVGFEFSDLAGRIQELGYNSLPLFFDLQETAGVLWINPDTLLPVQLDAECNIGSCYLTNFKEMKLSEVDDYFEYDVEMDECLFMPQIPKDYELFGMPEIKTGAVIGAAGSAAVMPFFVWLRRRKRHAMIAASGKNV